MTKSKSQQEIEVPDDIRIVRLSVENFMRLRALELTPAGHGGCTILSGANTSGKTATLRSLSAALTGDRPANPIHDGKDQAIIIVETTQFVVKLKIIRAADGPKYRLVVKSLDGTHTYTNPVAMLRAALGKRLLDPTEFLRDSPEKQLQLFLDIANVDVKGYDTDYEVSFTERTDVNREVKRLQAHRASLQAPPADLPQRERDTMELTELRDELLCKQGGRDVATNDFREMTNLVTLKQERVDQLTREFEEAQQRLANAEHRRDTAAGEMETFATDLNEQITQVEEEIATVQEQNLAVVRAADYMRTSTDLNKAEKAAAALTARIEKIKVEKAVALAAAQLPVDGITLTEAGVLYNGQPLDGASGAERMDFAVRIGMALNPKLKVLMMEHGGDLDPESLRAITNLTAGKGYWLLLEHAGTINLEEVGLDENQMQVVVIEDGKVAGRN